MELKNIVTPNNRARVRWGWLKKTLMAIVASVIVCLMLLFMTPWGIDLRTNLAEMVINTQHREWAWLLVGAEKRDDMVNKMQKQIDVWGVDKQHDGLIKLDKRKRTASELIKVVDIQDEIHKIPTWRGKKMYVYDPRTIRLVTTSHKQEGEKITDMVKRTGALAGVNGGAFDDPQGLGNGFAPIGFLMSGGKVILTEYDGSVKQHIVGFTKNGILKIGLYSIDELIKDGVTDAAFWKPRIIEDGKGLITSGDGGAGRDPRTALCQTGNGTIIFLVIDGRQPGHSMGATLKEVQDIFLSEGCMNAGFLDGGASSELVADGKLQTKPASRYGERRLPDGFLVLADPSSYKPDNMWEGLTKIDAGGAYDNPGFQQEQAKLRAKAEHTSSPPKPTATHKPQAGKGLDQPPATTPRPSPPSPTSTKGKSTAKPSPSSSPNEDRTSSVKK
ncbi:phosphodiester glycosidase family protein [Paenibacillus alba]|uniref:Phosphodiester glycosidase family protein n=1 Tax=Paenibacillus alba TaxID=1197127 RepID=A0ABU6FXB7_9BACL|nr:phosphodiester glycosidase family protein [Paenibacillus alba]MEC0226549.1 phosphodiester glycosidase family protein [Paenibacillus alba]